MTITTYSILNNYQYDSKSVSSQLLDTLSLPIRIGLGGRRVDLTQNGQGETVHSTAKKIALLALSIIIFPIGIVGIICLAVKALTAEETRLTHFLNGMSPASGESVLHGDEHNTAQVESKEASSTEITPSTLRNIFVNSEGIPDQVLKDAIKLISNDTKARDWVTHNETFIEGKWSHFELGKLTTWTLTLIDTRLMEEQPKRELTEDAKVALENTLSHLNLIPKSPQEIEAEKKRITDFDIYLAQANFEAGIVPISGISKDTVDLEGTIKKIVVEIVV